MNRALELADRSLRILIRLFEMLLDHGEALDARALLGREEFEDLAAFSLLGAREDDDLIAALDVKFMHGYRTSRASEIIFMKFFARSSRATGPKMRVPRGLLVASMITIALESKRR